MRFAAIISVTSTLMVAVLGEAMTSRIIEGSYIIKLKGDTRIPIQAHLDSVKELFSKQRSAGNSIESVYDNLGNMYNAKLTEDVLDKVKAMKEVEYVENDAEVKMFATQANAPWGLARISSRTKLPAAGPYSYTYTGDGSGVSVYVVDTGIKIDHPEFEGRARFGAKFAGKNNDDENGHGTHCAGTVGSKSYGVSKKVDLVAVKVLDGAGSGTLSGVVSGINWAAGDKKGTKGNVISMSLGGGKTQALNDAADAAYKKGFVVVVAAGNENQDACNVSPASTPSAITVAAMDVKDARASFSNFGKCVDVFGPGVNILSTWNNGATNTISGTSMATPHVAGLAAYYLSLEALTNDQLIAKISSTATKNLITNPGTGSPNLMVNNSV